MTPSPSNFSHLGPFWQCYLHLSMVFLLLHSTSFPLQMFSSFSFFVCFLLFCGPNVFLLQISPPFSFSVFLLLRGSNIFLLQIFSSSSFSLATGWVWLGLPVIFNCFNWNEKWKMALRVDKITFIPLLKSIVLTFAALASPLLCCRGLRPKMNKWEFWNCDKFHRCKLTRIKTI